MNHTLLLDLARAKKPVARSTLLDKPDADLCCEALRNLERFHFVYEPKPRRYDLRYGLLRDWLRRRQLGLE